MRSGPFEQGVNEVRQTIVSITTHKPFLSVPHIADAEECLEETARGEVEVYLRVSRLDARDHYLDMNEKWIAQK